MSPSSASDAPARSADERAAELNKAIRALWPHPDARLDDQQRAEYRRLLAELRQVERGDVTTAA